jgi:hypothetical protein
MKLQIIQLEPYDDVASVRDRLALVRAERVLLIWPRGESSVKPILGRKLDLVLIQREAARRGIQLALVTANPNILDFAAELNIATFRSIRASQRGRWKKPRNKVFVDRSDRPDDGPDPRELMLHRSRLQVLSPWQRLTRRTLRFAIALILIISLAGITYLLAPGASVTIFPAQAQIDTTVTLTADPGITFVDVEGMRIPATLDTIEVESQASIPTTGIADVPTTLASGTVIFTNRIQSQVKIPAGTILSTPGDKPARFRTVDDAVIPAGVGQTVSVTIQATDDSAGPAGNIEPDLIINIDGDLSRMLSVRNPEATQGGTVRQQNIVARADYDNLLILAREKVRQDALTEFAAQLTGTQLVVPDSIKLTNVGDEEATYSAFVGDPADNLTLNLRARVQALVIDEQAARQAAVARLSAEIPPGRQLITESLKYTRGPLQSTVDGRATFVMSASGNVAASIDADRVRQRIAGMSVEAAQNLLNMEWLLDPNRPPQIDVWPQFWGTLPVLPMRINVLVKAQ